MTTGMVCCCHSRLVVRGGGNPKGPASDHVNVASNLHQANEEVPVSDINRYLAVPFGDVCRKGERLLAPSDFLLHVAFEITLMCVLRL